jgi:hypothetical protein
MIYSKTFVNVTMNPCAIIIIIIIIIKTEEHSYGCF